MRRKKEQAELTRKEIISASVKIMNQKGIALTRFEDIANEANVTRGAIYHYFKSKNEILLAIHENNKKKLFDIFEKYISEEIDPIMSLKKGLKEILTKYANNLEFRSTEMLFLKAEFSSLLKTDNDMNKIFKEERNKTMTRLVDLVRRGQKLGSIRNDISTENIVLSLIANYIGFVTIWYLEIGEVDSNIDPENYIEILLSGIRS